MTNFYTLVLLILTFITLIARGYKHLIIPLVFTFILLGYRLYHQEHKKFMIAVKNGETRRVQRYLTYHADPNYHHIGITPLSLAAKEGHKEVIKLLLAHGARPEEGALQRAQQNNHQEIVALLSQSS